MYKLTECDQTIDNYIIQEISELYKDPPYADIIIEKISANKTRNILNFRAVIANYGLASLEESNLTLYSDGIEITSFNVGKMDIGVRRIILVTNVKVPREADKIDFEIDNFGAQELSTDNNMASISIIRPTS
jgi:hypothetical protein